MQMVHSKYGLVRTCYMEDDASTWRLSEMANGMERSRILSIAAEVRQMISEGHKVAPFTVGDFSPTHFDVPELLLEKITESLNAKETNYPPAAGMPELRQSLANWMEKRYGVKVGPSGIVVGSGARPVLYASFRLFMDPGDGLAHGVPAWNNHYYVHINGAKDIILPGTRESRFLPTAECVQSRIDEIRVLILNSPLNPTGTCFSAEELSSICDVILAENKRRLEIGRKPVILVYDQVYSTMTAKGIEHVHPVKLRPEMFDYTVTLDAISKSITGTGLRLGWMALPPDLAPPVVALIGHMGAWPAKPIQSAAAKLYADIDYLEEYFESLDEKIQDRMNVLLERLSAMRISGHPIDFVEPEGGIYLSVKFDLFEKCKLTTNEEIRSWLLEKAGIAVVPFQAFGLNEESGWFRISIGSVSVADVVDAMDRLENALNL